MKLHLKQLVPVGAGLTVDYGPLFFGANPELCKFQLSEFLRKVLETPAVRREPTTPRNQDIIEPLTLHNPFLCCTVYNRSRMILQLRPRYGRTHLFTEPADSSSSEQDDVMLSEPIETPIPKCITTDNRIASTPTHDMSFSSTPDLSASSILCQTVTDELHTELMPSEEDIQLLHGLSFLSVEDLKCLFRNIQSEFSLSDRSSKELWRLLSVTLPHKNHLHSYWSFLEDQKHEFVLYQETIKTEKVAKLSLISICRFQKFYHSMPWSLYRQDMNA